MVSLTVFKEGHQLGGVSLEGGGVEQMELAIGDSEVLVDFLPLKEKEGFLYPRGFVKGPLEDILDEV
jgi:hypothetical protein